MDSTFNMDFILGNSIQRRSGSCISSDVRKQNRIYENMVTEDKEERMLPDSSLSPSNQTFLSYLMDESKSSDTECNKISFNKDNANTNVSIYNKHCRLVIDSKGDEYLVAETHLVPIVEACKDLFKHRPPTPNKEGSITTTTTTNIMSHSVTDCIRSDIMESAPISETFLYASQLALVEVKLRDLERELSNLDTRSVSDFTNSASNLNYIDGQSFLSQGLELGSSGGPMATENDIVDMDDDRRYRLKQMVDKHCELKKWLSKLKKKLKEKDASKLCHIVDFSSRACSDLPLPDYLDHKQVAPFYLSTYDHHCDLESCTDEELSPDVREHCNVAHLSQLISNHGYDRDEDENGNIISETKMSISQAPSKAGSDPEGIPNLSYEYDSCRDSDINYKCTKSSTDDQVVSTDSEGLTRRNPPTPDLRRAELDSTDISEGIRVLVVQKNYLRAGVVHLTTSDADNDQKLWKVTIDGDRKCQDIVISEWQLLEQGVREVIPTSVSQLSPGSRVCANWSEQLPLNLYPGSISLSSADDVLTLNRLAIDFDDGDHKDVDLDQVRLLPENFPNLHELMKASHFLDSNFYSLDRKNRIKKKRLTRLKKEVTNKRKSVKVTKSKGVNISLTKKRAAKNTSTRKKKVVLQWKLIKLNDGSLDQYELVRNLDNVCIRAGDDVQLLSYSRRHNYMANVVSVLARHQSAVMEIQFNWYYILSDVQDNSDIIKRLKKTTISKKVLFKTSHSDINDVYCVLRKVEVLSFDEYQGKYMRQCTKREVPPHSYVMAGRYDQANTRVESLDDDITHYIFSSGTH